MWTWGNVSGDQPLVKTQEGTTQPDLRSEITATRPREPMTIVIPYILIIHDANGYFTCRSLSCGFSLPYHDKGESDGAASHDRESARSRPVKRGCGSGPGSLLSAPFSGEACQFLAVFQCMSLYLTKSEYTLALEKESG